MPRRPTLLGLIAPGAACVLSACAAFGHGEPIADPSGQPRESLAFNAYQSPPAQPPVAQIGDVVLSPSSYYWRVDGVISSRTPAIDPAAAVTISSDEGGTGP